MAHLNPFRNATGRSLNVLITVASTIGFLLFGYDNGVFSGIIVNPWFLKTFNHPSASILGTVSASYNLGGFVGSTIAFFIGDALGRRRTILTGIAITIIGAIPFCAATQISTLLGGRITAGIGVGVMTSTVGIWQAETTPARSRGAYLVAQLIFGAAFGLFMAQWINFGFYQSTGRAAFAFPVGFQLVFLVISGALILCLPESPRWLVKKDRTDEAVQILERLLGPEEAQQRLLQITEADNLEKTVSGNQFSALLRNGPTQNVRRLCLACGVMIMHQLGGINSVTYYFPTLLQKFLGTTHKETLWIAGLSSLDSILFGTVAVVTIDRLGRRGFLVYGSLFQCLAFIIIASLLATSPPGDRTYVSAAVAVLFIYYGVNAACWLGPSWAYPAEILPLQIREKGLALGNICYWLFQFMFVEVTPIALDTIYYRYYIILAALNFMNSAIVWFFYPETARKSLEELNFYFVEKHGVPVGEVHVNKQDQGVTEIEMADQPDDNAA